MTTGATEPTTSADRRPGTDRLGRVLRNLGTLVPVVVGLGGLIVVVGSRLALQDADVADDLGLWLVPNPLGSWAPDQLRVALGVGMFVVLAAWLLVWDATRRGVWRPPALGAVAGLWSIPVLISPPLLSRDIYTYLAHGATIDSGFDPYTFEPGELGDAELVSAVSPVWRETPMIYGPLFGRLTSLLTVPDHIVSVLLFRIAVLIAIAMTVLIVARMSDDLAIVIVGVAMNPIVLLHGVGGLHIDVFLAVLLVAAVAAEVHDRPGLAVAAAAAAVEVKATALVGLGALVLIHLVTSVTWAQRARGLVRDVVVTVVVVTVCSLLVPNGLGWILNVTAPTDGGETFKTPFIAYTRLVGDGVVAAVLWGFVVIAVLVALNSVRLRGAARQDRVGLSLAFGAFMTPVLYAWYLLPSLALLAGGRSRAARVVFLAATAFGGMLSLYGFRELLGSRPMQVTIALFVAVAAALLWSRSRRRSEPPTSTG